MRLATATPTIRPVLTPEWPAADLGDWFVLRTRARQEKVLAADLAAQSIGHFLPLIKSVRYYAGRRAVVEAPLFPGYVFLRGARDDAYTADRTRRIAQIVTVTNQAKLDGELQGLFLAVTNGAPLDPYPYLTKGTLVEVRAGPFRGMRGLIECRSRANLLILQVEMLGRAVSLEIDGSLLDVIDDEPAAFGGRGPAKAVLHR